MNQTNADKLISDLVKIAETKTYFWDGEAECTGKYDENGNNRIALEIGRQLYEIGGASLMLHAYYQVREKAGHISAHSLEMAWSGIGDWG